MSHSLRLLSLAGVAVAVLSLSACDLTSLNDDPNNPTQRNPTFFLSSAEVNLADTYWDAFNNGRFAILYAQYWTQNQYTDEDRYAYRPGVVNNYWNSFYLSISNLQEIKDVVDETVDSIVDPANAANAVNQRAAAEILQIWSFQVLTDIYGDIPYAEALGGVENPAPAYTAQEEIYPDLIRRLTEVQGTIEVEGDVTGDVIFGGDAAKWKRFANSLKMRVAMRMADRMPDQAAAAIREAIAAGPMTSKADAATFTFEASQPYSNPIWENYNIAGRDDWAVTDALVAQLQGDPRLPVYVDPTPASEDSETPAYVGLDYGLAGGIAAAIPRSSFSRPGAAIRTQTAPALLMLYDEVLFIQAEAAARGLVPGDANALFKSAVAASLNYWTPGTGAANTTFVNGLGVVTSDNYRQVLGVQKWLALYMQGVQGWSEWRRLDFTGVLGAPAGGKLDEFSGPIAVRLVYPALEGSLNGTNLAAAVASQGPDTQGTKLWWDAN